MSPLTSTFTFPGIGWPQVHDATATAGACVRRNLVLLPRRFLRSLCILCRWHDSFQRGRTHFPTAESGLFSMAMASKAGIRGAISGLSSDPPHPQPISRREVSPGPGTLPTPPPLQKQNKSPALPLHKPTQHARHMATCTPSPNHFHHRQVSSHPSHHPPQHQTRRIRIPAQIRGPIRSRLHVATPVPTRRISQTPPAKHPQSIR